MVLLKEFVVLKELSLLLKACDIFSILTAVNIESEVLINLEFVERSYLKFGKRGVDKDLLQVYITFSNGRTWHSLHNLQATSLVRNARLLGFQGSLRARLHMDGRLATGDSADRQGGLDGRKWVGRMDGCVFT